MSLPAGQAHQPLLIDVNELRRLLTGGRVRLLHAGGPRQFRDAPAFVVRSRSSWRLRQAACTVGAR